MSNIIQARDPGIIAAEINQIKRQVQETVIYASIRIGEKLAEAKSMVNHGEWGKWLEENVEYSTSTAENLMKLYREYGTNQESLFDSWTNSQAFGKLSYTQHLALLALPFSDRQEFAEQHNVAEMSTRELQKAIRERDEALRQQETLEASLRDAEQRLLDAQQVAGKAKSDESAWQEQIEKLQSARETAERNAADTKKQLDQAQQQLQEAQKQEAAIRAELRAARENPHVPESLMEQLRKEAEAEAAARVTKEARKTMERAQGDMESSEREIAELKEKLEAAERRAAKANPTIMEYNTLAQKLQQDYSILDGLRRKMTVHDRAIGEKLLQFQMHMVSAWLDGMK